ncbi:MAG: hypothetical protein R3175_13170 [Marinobacter sp.]|uniref:hypothetical protein n=1 Tax=Marinobacter sp. TaxID=50741 RepID=UPI00299CE05C|nr:hypothetical protein [Marinobacter sp.]MDX1757006.1 hypothetical protein [Marinobacter sp.]
MNWRAAILILVCCLLLVISGCATYRYDAAPSEATTPECEAQFRGWQAHIEQTGTFDAQAWSPPGFPYLRVDRFLASFEFTALSREQQREWLQRAHQKAVEAWQQEAEGQADSIRQRIEGLRACGEQAIDRLQASPGLWPELEAAKAVPDSYSTAARVFGLYPLVAPVMNWRASAIMGDLRESFGNYRSSAPWQYYRPAAGSPGIDVGALVASARRRSALGVPDFAAEELRALFQRFAPTFAVETHDLNDLPGRPGRGLAGELRMLSEPVVYTLLAYTRRHGQVLPQLVYTVWFPARPKEGRLDIYAGALDGFVWRVTLGAEGQPLVYDYMHACGCYHQWLLVDGGLEVKGAGDTKNPVNGEPLWVVGTTGRRQGLPILYLSSREHHLVDVGGDDRRDAGEPYRLEPYQALRGQSYAGGRLFDSGGMVPGSERAERWLLWPAGIPSAGAMRQWGRHAVAFTGRRHFDDPFLLERYFKAAP